MRPMLMLRRFDFERYSLGSNNHLGLYWGGNLFVGYIILTIRPFQESDREAVNAILLASGLTELPKRVGALGFVAEEEQIVGFIWAVTAPDTDTAYIDDFCVLPSLRNGGIGLALITYMISFLISIGKTRVLGMVIEGGPTSVARMYRLAGADVLPAMMIRCEPQKVVSTLGAWRKNG